MGSMASEEVIQEGLKKLDKLVPVDVPDDDPLAKAVQVDLSDD